MGIAAVGERVLDGVAFKEVEAGGELRADGGVAERGFEMRVEIAVFLHGPHVGASFEECGRERAEAGTDFDDSVAGRDAGEFERFADDIAVDEEVLPEEALRLVAEGGEEIAGGGRGKGHFRKGTKVQGPRSKGRSVGRRVSAGRGLRRLRSSRRT